VPSGDADAGLADRRPHCSLMVRRAHRSSGVPARRILRTEPEKSLQLKKSAVAPLKNPRLI
jgi:hypothetical protein